MTALTLPAKIISTEATGAYSEVMSIRLPTCFISQCATLCPQHRAERTTAAKYPALIHCMPRRKYILCVCRQSFLALKCEQNC